MCVFDWVDVGHTNVMSVNQKAHDQNCSATCLNGDINYRVFANVTKDSQTWSSKTWDYICDLHLLLNTVDPRSQYENNSAFTDNPWANLRSTTACRSHGSNNKMHTETNEDRNTAYSVCEQTPLQSTLLLWDQRSICCGSEEHPSYKVTYVMHQRTRNEHIVWAQTDIGSAPWLVYDAEIYLHHRRARSSTPTTSLSVSLSSRRRQIVIACLTHMWPACSTYLQRRSSVSVNQIKKLRSIQKWISRHGYTKSQRGLT